MLLKVAVLLLLLAAVDVNAHGRLLEPPNRSTLWRFQETDPAIMKYSEIIEPNWTDNELFCGGFMHQVNQGGKCGLCGDPWDGVRENEAGGKYGKGIIVRQYPQGSLMDLRVELTAHHMGYFEFRLCVWNNPTVPGTHQCLDQNLLKFSDGSTKYYANPNIAGGPWRYEMKVQLPADVTCTQCILQWRYHTENTWNCDENDKCCLGCGPQEEFYGCADIAIGTEPTLPPPGWNEEPQPTTTTLISRLTSSSDEPSTTTTTTTSTTTTTTTTTSGNELPSTGVTCQGKPSGKYKADCTTYYTCSDNDGKLFLYDCPPGTVYDEYRQMCDHERNVPLPCGSKS